jgi:uncharacterized protein
VADPATWLLLLLVGAAAGILSGLFGIGGGILMTPVLHYVVDRPWAEAVALSLFAIAVQSPLGVYQHARRGSVDWRLGALLAAATLPGVWLGAWLLPRVPVGYLKVAFAAVMAVGAWRMVARLPEPRVRPLRLVTFTVGVFSGVASRLFGIGGGLVTVPVLVMAGTAPHLAVGSSLVAVFVAAAVATGGTLHHLHPSSGILLGIGALLGVTSGVGLAHRMNAQHLKGWFAGALVLAAFYIALTSGAWSTSQGA